MRLRLSLAALLIASLASSSVFATGTLYEVLNNGPRSNRINIAFLGDGYTAAEEGKFVSDVGDILAHMLGKSPFGDYSNYLNAYAIYVESNESGADHPSSGIYVDTYFDGTFEVAGITRLTGISSAGYSRVYALLGEHIPEYDIVLMILNDTQYGGSGGTIAITSINSAAPEVALHEIGHSFGSLADEYDTYTPGYSGREDINTTAQTTRELIRWGNWISGSTPVPTPETSTYGSVVGLFEGACYETTGWYRPMLNCEMKSLNRPFCQVCQEQIIKMEYNRLNIIEATLPVTASLTLGWRETAELSIATIIPGGGAAQWYVDDLPQTGETGLTYVVSNLIGEGIHQVRVEVSDPTLMVQVDPSGLLWDSHSWNVTYGEAECCGEFTGGVTGNVDCLEDGRRNLADITRLIDRIYVSKEPLCCEESGNIDGSANGSINLTDVTRLIDHVYVSRLETAPCR